MRVFETPINTDDASFQRAVLQAPLPVVAVFWSPEETPTETLDPVLDQAAKAYAGKALVVKLEVKDASEARARYEVGQVPQFLFFRDGGLVARAKGMPTVQALRPWVEYLLGRGTQPATTGPREQRASPSDDHPIAVTDGDFERVVLGADVPVVVDFWAAWCGPCRMVAPVVEDLARTFAGRARFAKLDVDANQATARRYGVMSIPTLIFFQHGREVDRVVGAQSKQVLQQRLDALL